MAVLILKKPMNYTAINVKRASRAKAAIKAHINRTQDHGVAAGKELEEHITDLLANLHHHLAIKNKLTVSQVVDRMTTLLRIGADHFKCEVQPEPVQPEPVVPLRCECGRPEIECATADNPKSEHKDR